MSRSGTWAWFMQRVSAALLIPLLVLHFAIMHFVDPEVILDFAGTSLRLQGLLYLAADSLLLMAALYHGLNGVRNVILDYWPRAGRGTAWVLWLLGLAAMGYGMTALAAFTRAV